MVEEGEAEKKIVWSIYFSSRDAVLCGNMEKAMGIKVSITLGRTFGKFGGGITSAALL